jgi:general secretion pathway protein L
MLKTLVIYLMNETELPCWEAEGVLHQGDLADLQSLAKHRRVIVVVPGEAVLLLHPHLPVMSRARVRQAIPFAVEEQLIDNLEAYHFAIADRQTEGTVPVAVVSDAAMKAWCARLAEWQIMPHVMVPLTLILPYQAGEWHAYQHQHALTVRTGPYEGFTCESAEVNTLRRQDMMQLGLCTRKLICRVFIVTRLCPSIYCKGPMQHNIQAGLA